MQAHTSKDILFAGLLERKKETRKDVMMVDGLVENLVCFTVCAVLKKKKKIQQEKEMNYNFYSQFCWLELSRVYLLLWFVWVWAYKACI